jgi:predicted kinase
MRALVLVSGPPAAGKTTLASPLARELGFALLAKDRIKETLHDCLGREADLAWSRRLGAAAMELLWALAADAPAVVLEANFWADDPRQQARVRSLGVQPVEVHCQCPVEECMRRYAERGPSRHPVHVDAAHADAMRADAMLGDTPGADTVRADSDELPRRVAEAFTRSARPIGLGPVIIADTTRPVDVPALASQVLDLLSPSAHAAADPAATHHPAATRPAATHAADVPA